LPIEDRSEQNGYTREAVLAPDVEWQDSYAGAWLRVTGHYNDRASADCREAPSPMEEFYPGPLLLETICRQRFVVTEVTVVDGPSS
jgi:hypothetical protein